jgi:hypothetical protein
MINCCYIGMTGRDLGTRMREHWRDDIRWIAQLDYLKIRIYDYREDALAAESEAITAERPRFNYWGNLGRDLGGINRVIHRPSELSTGRPQDHP